MTFLHPACHSREGGNPEYLHRKYLPQLFGYEPDSTKLKKYMTPRNLDIIKNLATILSNSPHSPSMEQIHEIQDSIIRALEIETANISHFEREDVKEDVLKFLYTVWIGGPVSYTFDKFLMLLNPKKLGDKTLKVLEKYGKGS